MNRLTKPVEGNWIENHDNDQRIGWKNGNRACMTRLAEYENTGLTPEEIMDGKLLTGWIPVRERLPEPHKDVLVAYRDFGEDISIFIDCLEDNNGKLTWSTYNGARDIVEAWMPLPEPYKLTIKA